MKKQNQRFYCAITLTIVEVEQAALSITTLFRGKNIKVSKLQKLKLYIAIGKRRISVKKEIE